MRLYGIPGFSTIKKRSKCGLQVHGNTLLIIRIDRSGNVLQCNVYMAMLRRVAAPHSFYKYLYQPFKLIPRRVKYLYKVSRCQITLDFE